MSTAPQGTTSTRSFARTLSLRAPISNEEERALFQRRLGITFGALFVLAFGFWVIQLLVLAWLRPEHAGHIFADPSSQVHLGTTFIAGLGALVLRFGHRSVRFLDFGDILVSLASCFGWSLMIVVPSMHPPMPNVQLVTLLAVMLTLSLRAALVPSSPARSTLVALAAMAPVLPAAYFANLRAHFSAADARDAAVFSAIWAVVGAANVTVISWVVYGLRLEVRKAMRLGQYVLEEKIGEGGMGVVFRAHHAMLRRETAIKLLTGSAGHAIARFEREVRITARLTHPNTIAVFDYGRTPDGVFYYAMEYLDGISLEDLVHRHGPQPPARVVHVLLQMCGALEEAHAAGLVHRDIKPANVMLTERGGIADVVKVLDFGLVKEITNADPTLSAVNTIVGTPHYMSPEAILDPATIDARADIYGVGATAFFLLTGERVFDGASLVEICSKHLHQEPDRPSARRPGIPPALEDVVLACLAKKPEARPPSAEALGDMLRATAMPEWSRADARSWWRASGASRPRSDTALQTSSIELGKTVAVALEDRA